MKQVLEVSRIILVPQAWPLFKLRQLWPTNPFEVQHGQSV